jgi:hypothetical protein
MFYYATCVNLTRKMDNIIYQTKVFKLMAVPETWKYIEVLFK